MLNAWVRRRSSSANKSDSVGDRVAEVAVAVAGAPSSSIESPPASSERSRLGCLEKSTVPRGGAVGCGDVLVVVASGTILSVPRLVVAGPPATTDQVPSVEVETEVPGVATEDVDVAKEGPGASGSTRAGVCWAPSLEVAERVRRPADRPRRLPVIPRRELTEDRAAGGMDNAAAEKRGLNNLRVLAPATPEMIRKEKRQDNEILE